MREVVAPTVTELVFFFSSRRRHTRFKCDWSSDVCSSDLALRFPPSSRIATFSLTPSSLAFATASSTIFCASSEEILCFFTTLAIGLLPRFDMYCVLIIPALRPFEPAFRVLPNHLAELLGITNPERLNQLSFHHPLGW